MSQQPVNPFAIGEHSPVAEYDRFALIYDTHFSEYSQRVLPALERLVLASLPRAARILDVCCGTGRLAAAMLEQGFAVSGVDGSREMLRIARRNAPQAEFLLQDVRRFRHPESFDAAVSTFDSINHIVEEPELLATFTNICRALRPGGLFVFDMNMEEGYRCRWGGTFHGSAGGRPFVIQAFYSRETKLGRNVVTWPEAEAGAPAPAQITFVERCYTEAVVRSALIEAGFPVVEVYDGHRDLGLVGEIGRAFFVCKKSDGAMKCRESELFGDANAPSPSVPQPNRTAVTDQAERGVPDRNSPSSARPRLRSIPTFVDDALWPGQELPQEAGIESRRLLALEEVLSTLPPKAYERLKEEVARFDWFIPSDMVLGQIHPFRAAVDWPKAEAGSRRWARVIYLSPLLEQQDWPLVVTVVVHELAHVILDHPILDLDRAAYDRQEEAVRHAVREWGYQAEADRAEEHLREQTAGRLLPESQGRIRPARPPLIQ